MDLSDFSTHSPWICPTDTGKTELANYSGCYFQLFDQPDPELHMNRSEHGILNSDGTLFSVPVLSLLDDWRWYTSTEPAVMALSS